MIPQIIYYKVFAPRYQSVIEKHELKRLARWKDRAASDKSITIVRCVLVETGYKQYMYHYEKIRF